MNNLRTAAITLLVAVLGCASPERGPKDDAVAQAPDAHDPSTAQSGEAEGLLGTAWRLLDLGGAGVLDDIEATLEFPEAGKVAGKGSCNRFFGTVDIAGQSIKFGAIGATRMACADAINNQEGKYLGALEDAERYTLTEQGTTLLIFPKSAEKPLSFARVKP